MLTALGAGLTGLEPATSYVTGRRSNQLSYNPETTLYYKRPRQDLNPRPLASKASALSRLSYKG